MVILTWRTEETKVLTISPDFISEIHILYHLRNPEIIKTVYLYFVEIETYKIKHFSPVQVEVSNIEEPLRININSETIRYLNNSYVFIATKNS